MSIPSGPFSHRDTLKIFETLLKERRVTVDEELLKITENLMAFRHVATKIYGFLIDTAKLGFIIQDIGANHNRLRQLIQDVVISIEEEETVR